MHQQRALVWFRDDLRLEDHPALYAAFERHEEVLLLYCIDPREEEEAFGFSRRGAFRNQFLHETISVLQHELKKRDQWLVIRKGKPEEIIPSLMQEFGIGKVYASRSIATYEKHIESSLKKKIGADHLVLMEANALYHLHQLPFPIDRMPHVFTSFRTAVEKHAEVNQPLPEPNWGASIIAVSDVWEVDNIFADPRRVLEFKGGCTEAARRVRHYCIDTAAISTYKFTRNGMLHADESSKFSPWLALGATSPRLIMQAIQEGEKKYGANESTYWLFFELLWREFFRLTALKYGSAIYKTRGISGSYRANRDDFPAVLNWINGDTGDDFVDANMRELQLTGWMSNRGRQNVASYFVLELKQDWRIGAAYFEHQLIDYDVHSNWCNWAYLAGVGNDPRQGRKFNTQKQANDYDALGEYRKKWLS